MKLSIQLVPRSCFYTNLRNIMKPDGWQKLSKERRQEVGECEVCGHKPNSISKLHLHEVWEFKYPSQRLIELSVVCELCHSVHHWGHSQLVKKDLSVLTKHACEVNQCSPFEWIEYVRICFQEWRERSVKKWTLDLGEYEDLVEKM